MQDLDGGFESEALARPVVDPRDGPPDLLVGDGIERHGLVEVPAQQSVGVLVQPPLPTVARVREVGVAAGGPGHGGVVGELPSVVVGDGTGDALEAVGDAVSDQDMQLLWSRVLAGEANAPGFFSKRTVNFLTDLDKTEARWFSNMYGYACQFQDGNLVPLVLDHETDIYNRHEIHFRSLSQLDSIGLIRFDLLFGFVLHDVPEHTQCCHHGKGLN